MSLARLVITAVTAEARSKGAVAPRLLAGLRLRFTGGRNGAFDAYACG